MGIEFVRDPANPANRVLRVWYNAGEMEPHFIRDRGGLAQFFMDDVKLWRGPLPE